MAVYVFCLCNTSSFGDFRFRASSRVESFDQHGGDSRGRGCATLYSAQVGFTIHPQRYLLAASTLSGIFLGSTHAGNRIPFVKIQE